MYNKQTMRVVLDTSVLVAGLRSRRSASFVLLKMVQARTLLPLVTIGMFFEYEDVLKRAEHLEATEMDIARIDRFLGALASVAEAVEVHMRWRPQLRDAGDELVLEAAINGRAEMLVTHNVRDFQDAAPRFGLTLTTPGALLARREDWRTLR